MALPNDGAPKIHALFASIETELYRPTLDEISKINKVENKSVKTK